VSFDIEQALDYYSETQGLLPEKLEEFGEKYTEQGYLTQDQLYEIAYESSTRSAYHVRKNPEKRCRKVTENVLKLDDDFSKIALISSLKGFKAPTASCLLAALDSERHAVVDTRVWASLERLGYVDKRKETFNAEDYVTMMKHIREIAEKQNYSTAEVGYALFAWDDKVREGNLH
jgi:thermostable 8-oxoguanine DNA glycosylase